MQWLDSPIPRYSAEPVLECTPSFLLFCTTQQPHVHSNLEKSNYHQLFGVSDQIAEYIACFFHLSCSRYTDPPVMAIQLFPVTLPSSQSIPLPSHLPASSQQPTLTSHTTYLSSVRCEQHPQFYFSDGTVIFLVYIFSCSLCILTIVDRFKNRVNAPFTGCIQVSSGSSPHSWTQFCCYLNQTWNCALVMVCCKKVSKMVWVSQISAKKAAATRTQSFWMVLSIKNLITFLPSYLAGMHSIFLHAFYQLILYTAMLARTIAKIS